jgi:hypothetical protein
MVKNKIISILKEIEAEEDEEKILPMIYKFKLLDNENKEEFRKAFMEISKEYGKVIDKTAQIMFSDKWVKFKEKMLKGGKEI